MRPGRNARIASALIANVARICADRAVEDAWKAEMVRRRMRRNPGPPREPALWRGITNSGRMWAGIR